MRPVTSQVAAEIGYDPAGGTDPGPFTQQVAERLHAADPRWGRRINSTGPISDDTVDDLGFVVVRSSSAALSSVQ